MTRLQCLFALAKWILVERRQTLVSYDDKTDWKVTKLSSRVYKLWKQTIQDGFMYVFKFLYVHKP